MDPFAAAATLPLFLPSHLVAQAVDPSELGALALGHDLVLTHRPRLLVRWGQTTPDGLYLACRQALIQNNLPCSSYAFLEKAASDQEQWIEATTDEAKARFGDGTIDLLLLEDLGSYEAAKASFHAWLPKLQSNGVVLLPDIAKRTEGSGTWRLWEALANEHRHSVALLEGRGLGVLFLGQQTEGKPVLLQWNEDFLRRYYSFYGAYLVNQLFGRHNTIPEEHYQVALRELQTAQAERMLTVHELKEVVEERNAAKRELYQIENDLQDQKAHSAQLDIDVANWKSMVGYEQNIREQILNSLSWKLTAPLRFGIAQLRKMLGRSAPQ